MPKIVDYPRCSFKRALELANAVEALGGKCSKETAADHMGVKVTGSFSALIGGCAKFNLISTGKGDLQVTALFKSINLAYTDEERRRHEIESFLSPSVFKNMYERFINKSIPEQILDKFLIKEFDVDSKTAPQVAKYFITGVNELQLRDEGGKLKSINSESEPQEEIEETEEVNVVSTQIAKKEPTQIIQESDEYSVNIKGPGIDSTIVIKELDDLTIISAMLNKIKNKLPQ